MNTMAMNDSDHAKTGEYMRLDVGNLVTDYSDNVKGIVADRIVLMAISPKAVSVVCIQR
jgi:hypothetical protein